MRMLAQLALALGLAAAPLAAVDVLASQGEEHPLPEAVQSELERYQDRVGDIVTSARRQLADERQELIARLDRQLTRLTRQGDLDAAVRVRDLIADLRAEPDDAIAAPLDGAGLRANADPATSELPPQGLRFAVYDGSFHQLPDFSALQPDHTGIAPRLDLGLAERPEYYAMRFGGHILIPAAGEYLFHLTSDDGSALYIDDRLVIDNDALQSATTLSASIELEAGLHRFDLRYFNNAADAALRLEWEAAGIPRQIVPERVLRQP